MTKENASPHAALLNEVSQKFGTFCDSVTMLDFTQYSDESFESFYASAVYGMQRLMTHLGKHHAAKQKQQITAFIRTNRDNYPALDKIDLQYYDPGHQLTQLHQLLLIDKRPMRERLKSLV